MANPTSTSTSTTTASTSISPSFTPNEKPIEPSSSTNQTHQNPPESRSTFSSKATASTQSNEIQTSADPDDIKSSTLRDVTLTLTPGTSSNNRVISSCAPKQQRSNGGNSPEPSSLQPEPTGNLWCELRARWSKKGCNKEQKKVVVFSTKPGKEHTIGSAASCTLTVEDRKSEDVHAVISSCVVGGKTGVYLFPKGRVLRRIGIKGQPSRSEILAVGSVFKVGAISLKVTALRANTGEVNEDRFALKKGCETEGVAPSGGVADVEEGEEEERFDESTECFICYLKDGEAEKAAGAGEDLGRRKNPLIRSPCLNPKNGCGVGHVDCFLQYIQKSGKEKCSTCHRPYPSEFVSTAPCLELKVVRHKWEFAWIGKRQFKILFSQADRISVGRSPEAEVILPCDSVQDVHARIELDRTTKQFLLKDNNSPTRTFLQVSRPQELSGQVSSHTPSCADLKIGKTNVTVRITNKKPKKRTSRFKIPFL